MMEIFFLVKQLWRLRRPNGFKAQQCTPRAWRPNDKSKTKEAQEALDQKVNGFLSRALGQNVSYSLNLNPNPELISH